MAKFDPLYIFLKTSKHSSVKLSFAQLQSIVGLMPPESRRDKSWWESTKFRPTPQARAWLDAGFEVTGIHLGDFIQFERKVPAAPKLEPSTDKEGVSPE